MNIETEQDYALDCGFTREGFCFRYRAAAIIIEDGCVLMASNGKYGYYYSVGGGVHLGETAEQAVVREVYEETGVHYDVDRLVFVHEHFFDGDGVTKGLRCHELALYFLMKPRGSKELNSHSLCMEGREYMNWIPVSELKNVEAYPSFFADRLLSLPDGVEHIATSE